ncbi:MAG: 2Fe-2S iron-sulfur cluster-binding protein [Actinomycetota bacterium]
MATIDFEGKRVPLRDGDTVGSALYRAGVRTFTRSLKHHRRRGLYCMTGDCPNCLVTVDGQPGCRACTTPAREGATVRRESGWPSTERDVLKITDHLHRFMPVGFYYKVFVRPRWAWEFAEKIIRRATGIGALPMGQAPRMKPSRHVHTDVLVVGGGAAGLAAAKAAGGTGARVLLCDEGVPGAAIAPGAARDRVVALARELDAVSNVTVLAGHTAVGVYDGPLVPVVGPDELLQIDPGRVIVATGAVETHAVFPGNDLPGVWLGRGAARLAGVHGVAPGDRAVVVADSVEGILHLGTLKAAGVTVLAAVVPEALAEAVPTDIEVLRGAKVLAAEGRSHLTAVRLSTQQGERTIECDVLTLSVGSAPRDGLLRMSGDVSVCGAGEVVLPGCSLEEAEASGAAAGVGAGEETPREPDPVAMGVDGYVCLCADVSVHDLEAAWAEGWQSSEILKRYTTATMGPCQGAMCGRHLAAFAAAGAASSGAGARTTARPPARTVRLGDIAGGVNEVIPKHTALHDTHGAAGARLDWSGSWIRPYHYGDWRGEYRAVRERVSLMDVSTLGKFLIAGRDATALVDRVFPTRVTDLTPGRSRYLLALDEAGYVMDDGLICALPDGRYYLTSTSGGADRMEAGLRNWADRFGIRAHVMNQTAMLGAINVAGPHARDLLAELSDDDLSAGAIRYPGHAEVTIAGVPCRAVRVGFVGELSFELHHPRSCSVALWTALIEAGAEWDIRPHGLDALDLLRMEKGHLYLAQDTLPDDYPDKLGLGWAVAMDKGDFIGRSSLERMAALPSERKLVGLRFDAEPQRGVPLMTGDRIVGRVTSCGHSPSLGYGVGLGWLRSVDGEFPSALTANGVGCRVVPTPFYDPEGARLRA